MSRLEASGAEGLSVGGVKRAIEAALQLLPDEELRIAQEGLMGVIAQLRHTLSDSSHPAAQEAIAQLDTAAAALERVRRHTDTSRNASQRYTDQI